MSLFDRVDVVVIDSSANIGCCFNAIILLLDGEEEQLPGFIDGAVVANLNSIIVSVKCFCSERQSEAFLNQLSSIKRHQSRQPGAQQCNAVDMIVVNRSMRGSANDFLHDAMGWQLLSEREEPQFSGENSSCQKSSE